MDRSLARIRRQWERWGAEDPYFGVIGDRERTADAAFFEEGRSHVAWAVAYTEEKFGAPLARQSALDFGSGLGRLTAALADHFDEAIGVDVTESMVAEAGRLHADREPRPQFVTNPNPDLSLFPDGRFDFVLSFLVLQHIPPHLSLRYIGEFVRVLRPGGGALFQAPEGLLRPKKLLDGRILGAKGRNLFSRARVRLFGGNTMEMHMLRREQVESAVTAAGGEVVFSEPDWSGGDWARSVVYVVRKP